MESSSPQPCQLHPSQSFPPSATHISLADDIFSSVLSEPTQIHPQQKIAASLHRAILPVAPLLGACPQLLLDLERARLSLRVGNHISEQPQWLAEHAQGTKKPFLTACECTVRLVVLSQQAGDLLGVLVTVSVAKDSKPSRRAELAQSVLQTSHEECGKRY